MTAPTIKPGKTFIWLGILTMLAGLIGAMIVGIGSAVALSKTVDGFARVVVPTDANCRLIFTKPGKYTVYYEYQGTMPDRDNDCKSSGRDQTITAANAPPPGLDVSLTGTDGTKVTSVRMTDDISVSGSGRAGVAIRQLTITTPGDYLVNVSENDGRKFILAFGRGGISKILPYVGLAALLGLGGFAAGLPMLLVTLSKRRKARAALAAPSATPGQWTPGQWTPGAQPAAPQPGGWQVPTVPPPAGPGTNPWSPAAPPATPPSQPDEGRSPWAPPPPSP